MDKFGYESFLEGKIKEEHSYIHLLESEISSQKQKITKFLKDLSSLRKSQNDLKIRNKQMQQRIIELQMQLKRSKQIRGSKVKQIQQKRLKQQKQSQLDPKTIFKSYLDNTFPKYKSIIKKLLKIFYIMEDHQKKQPIQKIKFYQIIFQGFVKRILDWIFPKKAQSEKSLSIAQNLIKQWKQKQKVDKKQLDKTNVILLKQAQYINKIQALQAEILMIKSSKNMVQSRLKTFQRGLQIKGGQFVGHLKKMIHESKQLQSGSHQKVQQVLQLFTKISQMNTNKSEKLKEQNKSILNEIPLIIDRHQVGSKRKAAPVLKKNIYGYYQQPQFAGNFTIGQTTKHVNNNKQTQTLSQDLCILTLHPVIMVTLIDGNIKPQRNRQSLQFYVKIKINDDRNIQSSVRQGYEPIWNEPFLLKDYDFPFINVILMHKSKGLRDYGIGGGKFSASSEQQKIVNIRKQKQFQGRVRFSLDYPKGNIYEFKITSVRLQIPQQKIILKQQVIIKFPYNQILSIDFILPQKIVYTQRSMIILQNSQQKMIASAIRVERKGEVPLTNIIGKEGNKQIVVDLQDQWKVIIQGQVYLIICEDQQPERIAQDLLEGGKGKYFSVRAPPPIITVTYANIILHASIKFPLVFHLKDNLNKLSIVRQQSNREITQQIIEPIITNEGYLKLSEFIKAPSKIYKFFIVTLQGEQVRLAHESHLFERLLKQIHLQISYKQDEIQQINYGRKVNRDRQKDYKQFTIESKQLILNHYKIFSKHFKRIGFVKYKLGYTIYDNQLLNQNKQRSINQSRKIQALRQGIYFIQIILSQIHLQTRSASSHYYCIINGQKSKVKQGKHILYKQYFILSFQFVQKFQLVLNYQIWQENTFGKNKIYQGKVIVNQQIMKIGALIINLDENGKDCLHFTGISIPEELIRLNINEICGEIEQQADWIGKIDPYIILQSKNRQILKTNYLDNIGSHPVWNNIDKQIIISFNSQISNERNKILDCRLYDYDLIGKDDYLGEVQINVKLNQQLLTSEKVSILYGNLVKQKRICGSLKINGQFQRIKQQKVRFSDEKNHKLSRNDIVYKLTIYKVEFKNWSQYKDDKGIIIIRNEDKILYQKSFIFSEIQNIQLNINYWLVNSKILMVEFKREYSHFFKKNIEIIGQATINIEGKEFICQHSDVINKQNIICGVMSWYSSIQDKVNYYFIQTPIYCKDSIIIKSDLDDELDLCHEAKRFFFFNRNIQFYVKKENKQIQLKFQQIKPNVIGVYYDEAFHQSSVCYFHHGLINSFEFKHEQRTDKCKDYQSRQYKQIKVIHWQPYQYSKPSSYEFRLYFSQSNEITTIKQELNKLENDYLIMKDPQIPIIFNSANIPNRVQIINIKTNSIQVSINISDESKIFIPNKGILYYKLQDYNLKSIMQLRFKYIYFYMKNIQKFKDYENIKITIWTSLSMKIFTANQVTCNQFILQNLNLLIANPPHNNNIFFQVEITGNKCGDKLGEKIVLLQSKFGLRMQGNKNQYRIVDNQNYRIYSNFKCNLIERDYEAKKIVDNTIHGMSFITLKQIQFQFNEDPSKRNIFIEINLLNQYQKLYLQKIRDNNIFKAEIESNFYIERSSVIEFNLIEEGVLSNSRIGNSSLIFSSGLLKKQVVSCSLQVKKDRQIIGKLIVKYQNIPKMKFIDIDMFTYISKDESINMIGQLQQFGENKQKYQKLTLTSKGNIARLQSQDSFIITKDPREYKIIINEKNSNKFLGEFKLCYQFIQGNKISVIQPLRISSNCLNGMMIIDYEYKLSEGIIFDENRQQYLMLVQLQIDLLTFKDYYNRIKQSFSIRLNSILRQNVIKVQNINKLLQRSNLIRFYIYNNQSCDISLLCKNEIVGTCRVDLPYIEGQQRIMILQKDQQKIGIFRLKVRYLNEQKYYKNMREIISIQGNNLIDTQYFVKMTPFIQIDLNLQNMVYITDLGLGRQKIFWNVHLIIDDDINLIVKDKDMFFDDLIGNAIIDKPKVRQIKDEVLEVSLVSQEQIRKGGNGLLRVSLSPIQYNLSQKPMMREQRLIRCYMMILGGFEIDKDIAKQIDCIEILLVIREGVKIELLKQFYKQNIDYYLSLKDIELQIDNNFMKDNRQNIQIQINLKRQDRIMIQQKIGGIDRLLISKEIFKIYKFISLKYEFIFFDRIYLWMFQKIPKGLQIYALTGQIYEKMHILSYEKYMIVFEAYQIYKFAKVDNVIIILKLKRLNNHIKNQCISEGSILDYKNNPVGHFYANIIRFKSEGEQYMKKINIGLSRHRWLKITINDANLTKDLELFSKMDPYCKIWLTSNKQIIKKTSVQDNIGLNPIWNQSFFIETNFEIYLEEELNFCVMDEEVTADRMIGQGKVKIKQILNKNIISLPIYYKSDEISGKIQIKVQLNSCYLIFRNKIIDHDNQDDFWIINERNKMNEKGLRIDLGINYPIDQQRQIMIRYKQIKKIYSFLQLKKNKNMGIYFNQYKVILMYDLYQ